jgi:hypothetical protein
MVAGIEKFKEHFKGHEKDYAVIGGAACDLLFAQAGLDFRATKDIDMVLCVEVVDKEFAQALKSFLDAGGYQARERSDGAKEYYRFHKPTNASYPFMLELFARKPGTIELPTDVTVTKIAVDDDVLSLSAILLEEGYYEALQGAKRDVDGVTVIDETMLIPFKARAFLDLSDRAKSGEKIDSKNIAKHRKDVFRLAQLLRKDATITVSEVMKTDLERFLTMDAEAGGMDLKALGIALTHDEAIGLIRSTYGLGTG